MSMLFVRKKVAGWRSPPSTWKPRQILKA
jgi:hypothetical protein